MQPATNVRLVLPVLIKGLHHHEGMYSKSGKYALINGRWKNLHQDAPHPKGVPIAHDPHAHAAAPAKHLSDDEWSKLHLPAENTNAGHYNGQLAKLKEWSEGGHAGAILGHGYGTNTYGKKLSLLANHLLGKMGSKHQVKPGQKAGEHEAVQPAQQAAAEHKEPAAAPAPAPAAPAPAPSEPEGKHSALDETELPPLSPSIFGSDLVFAGKIADAAMAGDFAAVKAALKHAEDSYHPHSAASGAVLEYAKAVKEAMQEKAEQGGEVVEAPAADGPPAKPQLKAPNYDADIVADAIEQKDETAIKNVIGAYEGDAPNADEKAVLAYASEALAYLKKTGGAAAPPAAAAEPAAPNPSPAKEKEPAAEPAKQADLAMPEFQEGKTKAGVKAYYEKVAKQVIDHAEAGNVAVLEDMKSYGLKPNSKGKISNTWAGKTANSKLMLQLHAAALVHAKGGAAAPAPSPQPAQPGSDPGQGAGSSQPTQGAAPAPAAQSLAGKPASDHLAQAEDAAKGPNVTGAVKAAAQEWLAANPGAWEELDDALGDLGYGHLAKFSDAATTPAPASTSKLAQIPWDAQLLPDTNSNAKSHNGQVAKIKAMAEAGDMAGLQAYIDSKAGGKQTYVKKQHLLAQLAASALAMDAPVAAAPEPAAPPAPAEDGVDSLTPEQKAGIMAWLNDDGTDTKPEHQQFQTLYHSLTPTLKKQLVKEQLAHIKATEGPKDGDTKPGADGGTLVFKDGRWHKQKEAAAAGLHPDAKAAVDSMSVAEMQAVVDKPGMPPSTVAYMKQKLAEAAAAPPAAAAEPEQHPIDAVPVPHDQIDLASSANFKKMAKLSIEKLKEKLKAGESEWLKGATKKMASGKIIVNLPHPTSTYAGTKMKFSGYGPGPEALHSYVEALKVAMGKPAKKAKAKPAAAPAAAAPGAPLGAPEPMDSWLQTGGQGGSNPGGKFKDPSGQEWYCKFPGDDDTAKSEVLAAKLYSLAGLASQDAKLITKGGKIGIASKWVEVKKAGSAAALAKVPGALDGFAVDAWLGNWDVIGLGLDNMQVGPDGKAMRVDAGGSLEYRAQGAKKPFGPEVEEMQTLVDKAKNPHSAAVFGGMTQADLTASVAKVLKISDVAIRAMVNQFGPGDAAAKQKLADTLIARKADLAKKYPQAAKAKKAIIFKPEEISAPPSFTNWGGSGKSGPSSKEFVNQANEQAVQAIFAAAKTGDPAAVENLEASTFNKDTGEVTGKAKVLEHPSQHVKGYAQQAINEIQAQLNPPKKFRFEGGHPLAALNSAYPSHPGMSSSAAVQKLGKYIVLGEPGTISVDDLQLPPAIKHSSAGGPLTSSTYAKKAQEAVAKMPKTQQQAIQSYTGSSYHEMNGSLWSGNPSGAAKAAGEALKTLGHDIEPGTLLSRKISLHGADLDALLKSAGKILQEPAIMSTSIRPSSWSGNVQLKMRVGPGVKGLWVGAGSMPGGGAMSKHSGEDEMILPPNTRLMVVKVSKGADSDGFGQGGMHVIECVVLPT